MVKQETQEIDGISFTCTQFAAMRAFTLFGRLVKTIGPAISVLSGANPDDDVAILTPMLAAALKDLEPEAASSLAAEVLAGTIAIVDGKNVALNSTQNIDRVFTGRLPTMFRALAFAVKTNYSDFFAEAAQSGGLQKTASE